MSTEYLIISVTKSDIGYLDQLEPMFYDYYKSMEDKGLVFNIIENGGTLWRKGIENGLGKSHNVLIALSNDIVVGFTWGYITLTPSYTGSKIIGIWNGLYLIPEFRSLGITKEMYIIMMRWFSEKNVHSVETQVLLGNQHSLQGAKNMGFEDEIIQLRKYLTTENWK
jgi:hypothetical protein